MNQSFNKGKVIIAGAGPGDPELLTVKTARYLQEADVVLTDRLVSEQILKNFISCRSRNNSRRQSNAAADFQLRRKRSMT